MKVYGLIAEFNPFHNGHKLFIDSIKQKYHPDVLIAVMSGNFVQRGDFAVLDKWDRARLAVEYGVDLVVELPMAYAVEPADLFAQGAVELLQLSGIDTLVFGTEEQVDFTDIAQKLLAADDSFKQDYQQSSATNLTDYYQSVGIDISKLPNQLLGLNYVKQIQEHQFEIAVKTIKRLPSDFSATKIRQKLNARQAITELTPPLTQQLINEEQLVTWDDYFPYLKYQITNSSLDELHQIYQMVEGLEYKLKKEIVSSNNFTQFIEQVKSKRYTMARLRRLMIYVLLNVKSSEINNVYKNPYLRILGFNETGQKYLNTLKKSDAKLITRVGKNEKDLLDLEIRADRIRQLVTDQEENFGRIPYMKGGTLMLNWDVQDVRRYKDKPFEFEEKLDLTAELKKRSEDVLDAEPVEVKGQLFNDNGLVISDVKVKTTLKVPSTRSLLPVELPLEIRINEAYNVDNVATEDLEDYNVVIPVDEEDPTVNVYESVIDNILLSIPQKVLTKKEATENIMPSGKNWEVISEDDFKKQKEEEHVNPEFAKLKDLFKNNDEKE